MLLRHVSNYDEGDIQALLPVYDWSTGHFLFLSLSYLQQVKQLSTNGTRRLVWVAEGKDKSAQRHKERTEEYEQPV